MSVPAQLIQQLMSGGAGPPQAGAGAPPMAAPPGIGNPQAKPPAASPMSQPAEKKGLVAAAMTNVSIAQNMLEQAMTAFQPGDKEYSAVLKALNTLASISAKRDSSDLVPAEVMQLNSQLPQMGGGTEVQRALAKMQQQGKPAMPQAA
jgi:hypothetical protein